MTTEMPVGITGDKAKQGYYSVRMSNQIIRKLKSYYKRQKKKNPRLRQYQVVEQAIMEFLDRYDI